MIFHWTICLIFTQVAIELYLEEFTTKLFDKHKWAWINKLKKKKKSLSEVGFEPTPQMRLVPETSALTTRPSWLVTILCKMYMIFTNAFRLLLCLYFNSKCLSIRYSDVIQWFILHFEMKWRYSRCWMCWYTCSVLNIYVIGYVMNENVRFHFFCSVENVDTSVMKFVRNVPVLFFYVEC